MWIAAELRIWEAQCAAIAQRSPDSINEMTHNGLWIRSGCPLEAVADAFGVRFEGADRGGKGRR